jgi:hypothetical protein
MAIINRFKMNRKTKAQTLVEFALVMPLLMLVIIGLFEVGRLIFMNSIVITAAREGARYGSATGQIGGTTQYKDCDAIVTAAEKADPLGIVNITIRYDHGPGTALFGPCGDTVTVTGGDRIVVEARAEYIPVAGLIPLTHKWIIATNERTLLGQVKLPTQPPVPSDEYSLYVDVVGLGQVYSIPPGIDTCSTSCSAIYDKDSVIELNPVLPFTAPTDSISWTGCNSVSGDTCYVTLNTSKTVTAFFHSSIQYTLTVVVIGHGSVSHAPEIDCGTTCVAQFDAGRSVVLSAVEDLGSKIEGWDYGACGESLNCSVTMTSDLTVTVTFIDMPPQELTVNITGDGIGRVTSDPAGIDCDTGTCTAFFPYGQNVTLTAVPDAVTEDIFGGWSGDCTTTNPVCKITMKFDATVNAEFKKPVCDIMHSGALPRFDKYKFSWTIYNNTPNVVIASVTVSWDYTDLNEAILSGGFDKTFIKAMPPDETFSPTPSNLSKGNHDLTLIFANSGKATNVNVRMTFSDQVCKDLVLDSTNASQIKP